MLVSNLGVEQYALHLRGGASLCTLGCPWNHPHGHPVVKVQSRCPGSLSQAAHPLIFLLISSKRIAPRVECITLNFLLNKATKICFGSSLFRRITLIHQHSSCIKPRQIALWPFTAAVEYLNHKFVFNYLYHPSFCSCGRSRRFGRGRNCFNEGKFSSRQQKHYA